ncbi:MAG: hypothetical protein IDH49_05940 [Gammaproteobacteria bacterium]|nr:hypothetical protein [Gammaproteobacteria bacterium]
MVGLSARRRARGAGGGVVIDKRSRWQRFYPALGEYCVRQSQQRDGNGVVSRRFVLAMRDFRQGFADTLRYPYRHGGVPQGCGGYAETPVIGRRRFGVTRNNMKVDVAGSKLITIIPSTHMRMDKRRHRLDEDDPEGQK